MNTEIVLLYAKGALMNCHVMEMPAWQKFFGLRTLILKLAQHSTFVCGNKRPRYTSALFGPIFVALRGSFAMRYFEDCLRVSKYNQFIWYNKCLLLMNQVTLMNL